MLSIFVVIVSIDNIHNMVLLFVFIFDLNNAFFQNIAQGKKKIVVVVVRIIDNMYNLIPR